MDNLHLKTPKGFQDSSPSEYKYNVVSDYFKHMESYYAFPVNLSPLSLAETFLKENPQAKEWVYQFKDKSNRDLVLNPDSLPAVIRLYSNKFHNTSERFSFCTPVFRYKRTRMRYYHHLGATFINETASHYINFILLDSMCRFLSKYRIDFKIKINHLGFWRDVFEYFGITTGEINNILINTRSMDIDDRILFISKIKDNKDLIALLEDIHEIGQVRNYNDLSELKQRLPDNIQTKLFDINKFCNYFSELNGYNYSIDLSDFHGAAFHDDISYQILNTENKVLGDGGGYHQLAYNLNDKLKTVYSIVVRMEDFISLANIDFRTNENAIFFQIGTDVCADNILFINEIRKLNFSVSEKFSSQSFSKSIASALKSGFKFYAYIGSEEVHKKEFKIKNLQSKESYTIKFENIFELTKLL